MAGLGKAFSYLITAQIQAVGLIFVAYWAGDWLNKNRPIGINWLVITFTIGVLGIAQTFYVVIRAAIVQGRESRGERRETPPQDPGAPR